MPLPHLTLQQTGLSMMSGIAMCSSSPARCLILLQISGKRDTVDTSQTADLQRFLLCSTYRLNAHKYLEPPQCDCAGISGHVAVPS